MIEVEPEVRRANWLLLIALVIFSIALCVTVFLWMRGVTQKRGGRVYPPTSLYFENIRHIQGRSMA